MLRIQLLFSKKAPFGRLCGSVHRLPPNRANGVFLFEGSPIRYNIAYQSCVHCITMRALGGGVGVGSKGCIHSP